MTLYYKRAQAQIKHIKQTMKFRLETPKTFSSFKQVNPHINLLEKANAMWNKGPSSTQVQFRNLTSQVAL